MDDKIIIGWFSGGVTSAVAIKKAIEHGLPVQAFYMETGAHHPDHDRFKEDCEKWYGQKIITLRSARYESPIDVILKDKYINGPSGARCTLKLKKELRFNLEKIVRFNHQIFGYEYEPKQINRAIKFQREYPSARAVFPLIELGWDKQRCLQELINNNIEVPAMYKLGYSNSNCIGCVKGGAGYWNKVRVDFPDVFESMAKAERAIGNTCLKKTVKSKSFKVYLDELDPQAGRHEDISLPECGVMCPVELDGLSLETDTAFLEHRILI